MNRPNRLRQEELDQRLRKVLSGVASQVTQETRDIVDQLIEVGEAPLALEVLIEMLVVAGASIDEPTEMEVAYLARALGLQASTADRLRPLTGDQVIPPPPEAGV